MQPQGMDPQILAMMATLTPQQRQMMMLQMQQNPYATNQFGASMAPGYPPMYGGSMYAPTTAPMANAGPGFGPRVANEPVPPPAKKERLRVKIKPEERGIYSSLFDIACPKGGSKIEGKEAAAFLKRSNLPKETLKQIWEIAAQSNQMALTRDEFYIALRLVALAQAGKEVSVQSIVIDLDAPIPRFEAPSTAPPPTQSYYHDTSQSVSSYAPSTTSDDDKYSITEQDITKYLKIYNNVDSEQKGYLDSREMKLVLERTHLPENITNALWTICDEQGSGTFPRPIAIVVMHLAVLAMKKQSLPRSIPPELKKRVTALLGNAPMMAPSTDSAFPGFSPPKMQAPSMDSQPSARMQPSGRTASGVIAGGDELAAVVKKEIENRKAEVAELRDEEAEAKQKIEGLRERNKLLGGQLQKMKDELATLRKTIAAQKSMDGRPGYQQPVAQHPEPRRAPPPTAPVRPPSNYPITTPVIQI